jgi:ComEC/Rec2-related protein
MTCVSDSFLQCLIVYWDSFMPAPHGVLLKGLTIGYDELSKVPLFKQALINTGTVHVAVVSGYNISLVINSTKVLLGNKVGVLHTVSYIVISLCYSIFTGFEAPIVRAWLMSSICLLAKLSGRALTGINVLIVTCLMMVLADKTLLDSYSFILSSGATLGLIVYGNLVSNYINKYVNITIGTLKEDLATSFAASLLVTPYIAYSFSRISLYSPLINMFLLWTIPYATLIGFGCVAVTFIDILIGTEFCKYLFIIVFPFLDIFVSGINYFGKFSFISSEIHVTKRVLMAYYFVLIILTLFVNNKLKKVKPNAIG